MNRPIPMHDAPVTTSFGSLRDGRAVLAVLPFAGLVGLGYAGAAAMSLNLVSEAQGIAVLWPAAGIAAGAMTLAWNKGRAAVLAAVLVAGFAVNMWLGNGSGRSLVFMVANAAEAVLFAWSFLRLTGGKAAIARPVDVLRLVTAAVSATSIAAIAGVAGLAALGQPGILSVEGWRLWLVADIVGILAFAPVFLARSAGDGPRSRAAEATLDLVAVAAVAAVAWFVLMSPGLTGTVLREQPLAAMLPILLWVGIRRSVAAAAWGGLAVAVLATFEVIAGRGLAGDPARLSDPVAAAQMLMATCALTLLTLATVFDERRRAKTLLDTAEERQRVAIEGAGAASWDIDIATGRGSWSSAHFAFLGLPPSPDGEGDHAAWRARVHPADLPRLDAAFQASLDGHTPYEAEYRVIHADTGETRWLSGFGRTLLDAGGKPWRSVGIIFDVTARYDGKRLDTFLLGLEDSLRDLSSAADIERTVAEVVGRELGAGRVLYSCVDDETWFTTGPCYTDGMEPVSGRFAVAPFGQAVAGTLTRGEVLRIDEVDADLRLTAAERAAYASVGIRADLTIPLHKGGRWVAALSAHHARPHHWTSGEVALMQAVAERTWAAVQRVHAERALAASEERFRALFDGAGIGMALIDADHRLSQVNRAYAAIHGRDAYDLNGRDTIALTHPDDAETQRVALDGLAAGATAAATYEKRYLRSDGRSVWVRVNATRLAGGHILTMVEDITARIEAEAHRAGRERRDGFLLRLQDRMRTIEAPHEVAALATAMLGEETRAGRVLYGEFDEVANIGRVDRNWLDGMPDATGAYPLDDFGQALETLMAGRQMVIDDVTADPRTAAHCARPDLAGLEIGATLDTPLMRDGRLVGLLAIQMPTPRAWTADEASLAAEVAGRTWAVMERLRIQADLRLKTEELESLVNAAPLGVAFFDRDHRYLRINEELALTNGAPAADHIGRTLEAMRPAIAKPLGALIDGVFESGRAQRNVEISGEMPQEPGITRHWLTNFYPVPSANGQITQVGVWVIDITARKVAELGLRDSEARMRAVIDAVPVGLVFADAPSGRITGGNALVEQILGHPVLPSPGIDEYRDWVGFHADGRQVEGREYPLARALAGEERPELVTLYRRGDGREAWVRFVAAPIRDTSGGVLGGVVASLDIDRERRIEEDLRELNADLERRVAAAVSARESALVQLHEAQKMETIGQLTGGVAHDFNNLLAAILSNLELLRKRVPDRQAAQLVEGAVRGAERGAALTRRLLAFARRQDLRPGRIDLGALVTGMEDLLARSLGPGIKVAVDLPAELPAVVADAGQLELAVLNLAVNARDAMPEGGTLTIAAHAAPVGAASGPAVDVTGGVTEVSSDSEETDGLAPGLYVRLLVRDTGGGMEPGVRARATEPFFTTKGPGKGTGLGLSMVQGLAAQSGGAMRIDSVLGQGTTIALWLPQDGAGAADRTAEGDRADMERDAAKTGDATRAHQIPENDAARVDMDGGTRMNDQDRDAPNGAAIDAPATAVPAPNPGARRILVVDDDILVAMGTVAMLEDLGHSVFEAHDGASALALLEANPDIDLVVTDHAMPGMTGAELARAIRATHPALPIVLATGYAELPPGQDPGLPRLAKPFRQIELQIAVDEALG